MENDLYTKRFAELLEKVWISPDLQRALDAIRPEGEPPLTTEEFRRQMLSEFSYALERGYRKNTQISFAEAAADAINSFPERLGERSEFLQEQCKEQFEDVLSELMLRVAQERMQEAEEIRDRESRPHQTEEALPFRHPKHGR